MTTLLVKDIEETFNDIAHRASNLLVIGTNEVNWQDAFDEAKNFITILREEHSTTPELTGSNGKECYDYLVKFVTLYLTEHFSVK